MAITILSQRSLCNLAYTVLGTRYKFRSMLTLTYLCPPANGKVAKRHINRCMQWLKRQTSLDFQYVWFAEFTHSGHVHFHVLLTIHPTQKLRDSLALWWYNNTGQGAGMYSNLATRQTYNVAQSIIAVISHRKSWQSLRLEDGAKRYILKYALKPYQKVIPAWYRNSGRWWSSSRGVRPEEGKPIDVTEAGLRRMLEDVNPGVGQWDILPKIIFTKSAH